MIVQMRTASNFLSPEEEHLREQERLVADMTEQLATKETEFAAAGAEFAAFRVAYLRRFAPLYAELDRLEADIARRVASANPTSAARKWAAEATAQAEESAGTYEQLGDMPEELAPHGRHAAELRDLYYQGARAFHPDLAIDPPERERRTKLMSAANAAYRAGDADALSRMLDTELARPEAVVGDGIEWKLVRAIRRLAQLRGRFTELVEVTDALATDALYRLFVEVRDEWDAGGDPLAEDERELHAKIASARAQLVALEMEAAGRVGTYRNG